MGARTWVESVRCLVRAWTRPRSLQVPSIASSNSRSAPPATELAQDREVKSRVGQLQAQGVLPVDAAADGVGGLAVGEALDVLEDGSDGEPSRRGGRLSAGGEQLGELVVAVERSEFIGDAEAKGAFGEGGLGDALGLFGDGKRRLWAE